MVNLIVQHSLRYRHNKTKQKENFFFSFYKKTKHIMAHNHIQCKRVLQSVHTKHAVRKHPRMSLGMHRVQNEHTELKHQQQRSLT